VGQDDAVEAVVRGVWRACAGLTDPRRPLGTFLFAGPPGVGKTLLARRLADALFGGDDALVQVDMASFGDRADAGRFLDLLEGRSAAAPETASGFSGVVLLERVERAHPAVVGPLVQLLETGTLPLSAKRTLFLRNALVVLTTPAGGVEAARQRAYGLSPTRRTADDPARDEAKARVRADLEKAFGPEFVARLDDVVLFGGLTRDDLVRVADLERDAVVRRLQERGVRLVVTDEARDWLVEKGADLTHGARALLRAFERHLADPLAESLLRGAFSGPGAVTARVREANGARALVFESGDGPAAGAPS
jgi:ATP-dependent Clp protease ATP-binding subunit ClpC